MYIAIVYNKQTLDKIYNIMGFCVKQVLISVYN